MNLCIDPTRCAGCKYCEPKASIVPKNTLGQPDPVKAKYYAEIAHAGQTYNDEVPYTYHLDAVVKVGERFGLTSPMFVSCFYLHDIIEDTRRSFNDVCSRFGEEVAENVYCVTSELGHNRKERNEKTYPKIAANPNAILLKLADRIANVEYGLASGGKTEMYAKEFAEFHKGLYRGYSQTEINMWNHLKRLLKIDY